MDPTCRGAVHALILFAGATAITLAACADDPAGPNANACNTQPAPPHCPGPRGTFAYLPELTLPIAFTGGTQRHMVHGDFNGDGRMDIAINEFRNSPTLNRVHLAFGQTDGSFTVASPVDNLQQPAEGWGTYALLVGDVNDDGRDDLIWNHRATANVVYVGLSTGGAEFSFGPRQVHTNSGWNPYTVVVGDMNGDGRADLVWNHRSPTFARTYIGFATGTDGSFTMVNNGVDRTGNYSGYSPARVGRFDSDAYDDILLNALSSTFNNTYIGRIQPANPSGFSIDWSLEQRGAGWGGFGLVTGNVDGVNGEDLVWYRAGIGETILRISLNNGPGSFGDLPQQQAVPLYSNFDPVVADFDGDGRADVLLNNVNQSNAFIVGFGTPDGFAFPTDVQTNPQNAQPLWSFFNSRFVGDVNGDGRADIVWMTSDGPARLYVALARPS